MEEMSDERWRLNPQQAEALVMAHTRRAILVTAPGSENDVLWGEFSDHGLMEPADAPSGMSFLHAWELTEAGHSTIAALSTPLASEGGT